MAIVKGARATHTTLECRDVAKSLAFYRDVMGLQVNPVSTLVGHVWGTNGHYAAALQSAHVTQQPLLNFYARPVPQASDVDAVHAKIEAVRERYGVRELTAPRREDPAKFGVGTYGFYLNDLDGNWWRVEENEGPFGPALLPHRAEPAGASCRRGRSATSPSRRCASRRAFASIATSSAWTSSGRRLTTRSVETRRAG